MTCLPRPATPEGQAGLDALLASPRRALRRLAPAVGTLAVITGRPAADAVEYGGLAAVPGLIVLGHYGGQRWQDGELTGPGSPLAVQAARQDLPGVLSRAGAPEGPWVEDKGHALADLGV